MSRSRVPITKPSLARWARRRRRAVVSVLAMMFLVLFGSLGVAMAIVSKGNLRTADTQLHVTRAVGAAETGLAVAQRRLIDAAARFYVDKGVIDAAFARKLWDGTLGSDDGRVVVQPPPSGHPEFGPPAGVAAALVAAHQADQNVVSFPGSISAAGVTSAPSGTDLAVYAAEGWVVTPPVAIDGAATADRAPAAFQITYAPLADGTNIRIIVTGFSAVNSTGSSYTFAADSQGVQRPITRTLSQDFLLSKRHTFAILSPSRVLLGKNVSVTGNLGVTYDNTAAADGTPMVLKSDFFGLDARLDDKLNMFLAGVRDYDVDGDGRLRIFHAREKLGLPSPAGLTTPSGEADTNAFADATRDGFLDDYDLFINHFDTSPRDGRVVLSAALTDGTPNAGRTPEFTRDEDLALQIDSSLPDRNRNGVFGYADANSNGRWDTGETIADFDPDRGVFSDVVLGWRDGALDRRDKYVKLRGSAAFKATQTAWNRDQGDWQLAVQGSVVPGKGPPVRFGVSDTNLPALTAASFDSSRTELASRADGASFAQQVADQLPAQTPATLAAYVEAQTSSAARRYWRADLDPGYVRARTGLDIYERMPFNSPAFSDWYYRPRYENMVFRNVTIPEGTNALFINCTFVGVTRVRSNTANTHPNWSLYGRMESVGGAAPTLITDPLDKSDFLRYTTGNIADGPTNYADFPDPPVINGSVRTGAERDTKRYSNNLRFHNCLIVGSIVSDTPAQFTQVRNKIQFTGSTRFSKTHPDEPTNADLNPDSADAAEIAKSSLMLPNYSVDIGAFNSPTDTYTGPGAPVGQNVNLFGTIIAGVLDIRGNTSIDGTLLLTFAPVAGQGPLQQNGVPVGNPANFNASIGYFGPEDGEQESVDPATLPSYTDSVFTTPTLTVGWDTNGDGLPDLPPSPPPSAEDIASGAARIVPFYGYGRINIEWDPGAEMPDGILLPVQAVPIGGTYHEGKL